MGVAKSDFSQMHRSSLDLIRHLKRFALIDLDSKKNATFVSELGADNSARL